MKRWISLLLLVSLSLSYCASAVAQDNAQATIEALQTQVAELSPATPTAAPEADVTPAELDYLENVAVAVDILVDGRQQMGFFREYPPDFAEPGYTLAMTIGTLGFLFVRDLKVDAAPSERLESFNEDWNETIDAFGAVAQAFVPPEGTEMTRAAFDDAFIELGAASDQLDAVLQELVELGLYTAMYQTTHPLPKPGTENIVGSITLTDSDAPWQLPICSGEGGYSDLARDAQVVIRDETGAILAVGKIEKSLTRSPSECEFTFRVYNVPPADFYQVTVASRDAPTYSFEEMEQQQWTISLSIGD